MNALTLAVSLLLAQQSPEAILETIDAVQEPPIPASGDMKAWHEKCNEVAEKRGKLIVDFYRKYPAHERTPSLLVNRWEGFFGHYQVPKLEVLDRVRKDLDQFLGEKQLPKNREVTLRLDAKEKLLRQWRLMKDAKLANNDAAANPYLDRALAPCMDFHKKYPQAVDGVYLFYSFSRMCEGSSREKEAVRLMATLYPTHRLGMGAVGKLRLLESVGKEVRLSFTDFQTGKAVDMQSLRGKVVLIDFWASWCQPCLIDIKEKLLPLYAEFQDKGLEILGISGDLTEQQGGRKMLEDYLRTNKLPWPIHYDGKGPGAGIALEWGISAWPTQFLVDKRGILRYIELGNKGRDLIKKLLDEQN